MKQWLKSLGKKFSAAIARKEEPDVLDEETVIYTGQEEPIPGVSKPGEFEFGMYVGTGGKSAVWLPAIADDPAVIAQLKTLKSGQQFRITGEESWGAMGTRVTAMEIPTGREMFEVPKKPAGPVILG